MFFGKHLPLTSYSRFPVRFLHVYVRIDTRSASVCRIRVDTHAQDKSYAASGHMEALSSVYMLFHFCHMSIQCAYMES